MTRKDLLKIPAALAKAKPAKRFELLNEAALKLALCGFFPEAWELWELAYQQPNRPPSGADKSAPRVVSFVLGRGAPWEPGTPVLEQTALGVEYTARCSLFGHSPPAPPEPLTGEPPANLDVAAATRWYYGALWLMFPRRDHVYRILRTPGQPDTPYFDGAAIRPAESRRGCDLMRELLARPMLGGDRSSAMLLVADQLAADGDDAGATVALGDYLTRYPSQSLRLPLSLLPLARILASGALRPAKATAEDAAEIVRAIRATIADRSATGEDLNAAQKQYRVPTSDSIFYLGPKETDELPLLFEDRSDFDRGFSVRSHCVGISTPTQASECTVSLTVGPPAKIKAAHVLTFPLEVKQDLYLRDAGEEDDSRRFAVAPGKYQVQVGFLRAQRDPEAPLDHWHVRVNLTAEG